VGHAERLLVLVIAVVVALGVIVVTTWDPTSTSAPVSARTPEPTTTRTSAPSQRPSPIISASASQAPEPIPSLTGAYSLSPSSGTTQTAFTLRIDLRDGDGQADVEQVSWGDGSRFRPRGGPAVTCPIPSPIPTGQPYRPTPSDAKVSYGHAWRHPGTYRVTVELVSYPQPCRSSKAETQRTQAQLVVHIGSGKITTNGPALPTIGAITEAEGASVPMTYLSFPAFDTDGELHSFTVDWGDGNTDGTTLEGICDDGSGAYYPGAQKGERSDFEANHQYAERGRHRAVVTVYSADCLGEDLQRTSRSISVRS
jgi:hypothetical protein